MSKRVWMFTGSRGCGKSTALARYPRPSEIHKAIVFDTEDSMSDILGQLAQHNLCFGRYIRAYDRLALNDKDRAAMLGRIAQGRLPWVGDAQRTTLANYWEWFVKQLAGAITPSSGLEYLLLDTIEPIEAAAAAWAEANKKKSGWPLGGGKAWGKAEVNAVRPLIENTMEACHQAGITDILLASHIKNPWAEYAPGKSRPVLDKVKPGGRLAIWSRITTGMFWLVRPARPQNATGAPSAIVLKARRGVVAISDTDEWQDTSTIPPRIPEFTWSAWRRYQEPGSGWDPLDPKEGELLYPDEKEMISELLSQEQMRLMVLGAELALNGHQPAIGLMRPARAKSGPCSQEEEIKVMAATGASKMHIATTLGITLREVIEVLR